MKISYQQLFIIMLCISHQALAITLYNNSHNPIQYNIFKKKWFQPYFLCKPFPVHRGTLPEHTSYKIDNLDAQTEYVVTFYDVCDAQHNQRHVIKGNQKKLPFDTKKKTRAKLPAFTEL